MKGKRRGDEDGKRIGEVKEGRKGNGRKGGREREGVQPTASVADPPRANAVLSLSDVCVCPLGLLA